MERADARDTLRFALVVGALTLLAYVPALGAGFIWDDDFYVTQNDTLLDLAGLGRIWLDTGANPQYYPLTFTSFWIEQRLHGLAPAGYHLVNVLLHVGSAILLFRILKLLEVPGAALAAGLFALHPLQVESVAWVTERKNVLSGFFFFAAALVYLRHSLRPSARRFPFLAFALFSCALLSKSVTAFLPVVLLLVLLWKKGRLGRRDLLPLGAMLLLGAASGLLTAHLERQQVGASGEEFALGFLARAQLSGRIFWFYLGKLLLPVRLAFLYPRFEPDPASVPAWGFLAAALLLPGSLWALRSRIGIGPCVALALYAVLLFPVLGFLNVFPMRYSHVADHFQYLACVGPLVLLAALGTRLGERRGRVFAARAAAALLLAGLAGMSFVHARAFHDPETLWRDTVSKYPQTWMAQYNLACLLDEQGKKDEAVAHLLAAIQANPGYTDALNNLGAIRLDEGKVEEAASYFERIVRSAPQHLTARYNLALALERSGQSERAIAQLEQLIRLTPDPRSMGNDMTALLYRKGWLGVPLEQSHAALASVLAHHGRSEEAVQHYRTAAALRPDLPGPWMSLGRLYQERNDPTRAAAAYREALRIAPDLAEARERLQALGSATSPARTP